MPGIESSFGRAVARSARTNESNEAGRAVVPGTAVPVDVAAGVGTLTARPSATGAVAYDVVPPETNEAEVKATAAPAVAAQDAGHHRERGRW